MGPLPDSVLNSLAEPDADARSGPRTTSGLALSCGLQNRGEDRASVLECLQEAIESDDVHLPYSMDRKQAIDRLRQLIPTTN
ncbi:hypothetical protein AWV80_08455 [Cupriavidus sp. UYMU48A]|nr:hypothetical protein AWV80_08455 [Cupriavidus sp. UYMU48A]